MMNKYIILIWLLSVAQIGSAQEAGSAQEVKLVRTKINDDIVVKLPKSFEPMSQHDINNRYVSYRKPIALYTGPDRQVDFGVNISPTYFKQGDMEILQGFYKSSIVVLYDSVNFIREEIEEINEVKFAIFEFTSIVRGEENSFSQKKPIRKYTLIHYALVGDDTYLFNFTCPFRQKEQWQQVAQEIMATIKIK